MKKGSIIIYTLILVVNLLWLTIAVAQTVNTVKIDLDVKSKTLKEVIQIIEQKSGIHFVYNEELVSTYSNITISGTARTVSSILNELLGKTSLRYLEQNGKIIIEKKSIAAPENKTAVNREQVIGRILEAGTDKPVRNASVYFDGTLNGTSSDPEGNFTLYPQGKMMPVIVSAVGYENATLTDFPKGKKALIYLDVKQNELEEVTISASDGMPLKEKLRIFRREFLGTSANARSCEILNEKDIRLSYNKKTNTLKASSENPIIVQNKNLGYTLKFFPNDITIAPDRTIVEGYQFFEEDTSRTTNEKIQRARENTYLGSQLHFIRSLWNDDLKKNDFRVSAGGKVSYDGIQIAYKDRHKVDYDSIVVSRDGEKYIHLNESVNIDYKRRNSLLSRGISDKDALIRSDGYSDPSALIWRGIIGSQRIGDALPLEYKVADLPPASPVPPAPAVDVGIKSIIASADTLRNRMPAEKLYIQFDKPYYSIGDTVWLKAYLFDAAFLTSSKSGVVYLEVANDTNKVLMRRILPVLAGLGAGNIVLNKEDIPEGSYTIRAYTNLMRNFGEDLVFRKNFYVSGSSAQSWLVTSKSVLSKEPGKENLRLDLQFNQFNKDPLRTHDLELRVIDGTRVLFRDKIQTDIDGKLDINFDLPEKADGKNISIVVLDPKDDNRKLTIPIPVNRPENTDVQFMPEGGNLVSGIKSKIGFKAIGEDGKGVEISGKVYNGLQEVATFNTTYKGMGSFELTPKEGEIYNAKITVNGITKDFPLPAVKNSGTVLRVSNLLNRDSIEVMVSSNLPSSTVPYYLIAQSRGIICYGAIIRVNGTPVNKQLAKSLFPTGIAKFTLMSADRQPLNERIIYIDHHDNLEITINPDKSGFKTRDSIALAIEVKDHEGKPVVGSFSIAVTDDSQIRTDSLSNTILTSMLLTSDLKGNIEDPGHYFQTTPQAAADLDHLLLTQGWRGYTWKDMFGLPAATEYQVESEFTVKGRVSNLFSKGLDKMPVQLMSLRPFLLKDTYTKADGSFEFSGFSGVDTLALIIQARNKNNKSFNVGVNVNEFKPPVFKSDGQRFMPWYVNSDTSLLRYIHTAIVKRQEVFGLPAGTNILEEVTINKKKSIKGSKNFNGAGNADDVVDQREMESFKTLNLFELMVRRFKYVYYSPARGYSYSYRPIWLSIDGIFPVTPFPGMMNSLTAENIKGIEMMSSLPYMTEYMRTVRRGPNYDATRDRTVYPVIFEVTTRGGRYASIKAPGLAFFRVMPFVGQEQFYQPKYAVKTNSTTKDLRPTIHWEPDIVTDKDGKAQLSFYSADTPGTYSIIMEGSDMNGNIGRQTGSITIKQ
jgi:hypothetical protein